MKSPHLLEFGKGQSALTESWDLFVGEVLLALTGEHATIALDDLDDAVKAIGPRVVIPMHHFNPRGVLKIEPVQRFLDRLPPEAITRVEGPELELTPETLPSDAPHVYVLEQSR